jgi:hypothetical protein
MGQDYAVSVGVWLRHRRPRRRADRGGVGAARSGEAGCRRVLRVLWTSRRVCAAARTLLSC